MCNGGSYFTTTKHSTWPKSAEFYQLSTGQDRFSEHETNFETMTVVVDHQTGAEYLRTPDGVCPLLTSMESRCARRRLVPMSKSSERIKTVLFVVLAPIYLPILLSMCAVIGAGIYIEDRVRGVAS